MSEQETIADDVMADMHAVAETLDDGQVLDPELVRRVRQRAERIRDDIRQQHGILDIGVELIREARDAR